MLRKSAFYQHRYGGVYQIDVPSSFDTDTGEEYVVYTHVYPFEVKTYHRKMSEFTDGRFRELAPNDVKELFSRDKESFQKEIIRAKQTK